MCCEAASSRSEMTEESLQRTCDRTSATVSSSEFSWHHYLRPSRLSINPSLCGGPSVGCPQRRHILDGIWKAMSLGADVRFAQAVQLPFSGLCSFPVARIKLECALIRHIEFTCSQLFSQYSIHSFCTGPKSARVLLFDLALSVAILAPNP